MSNEEHIHPAFTAWANAGGAPTAARATAAAAAGDEPGDEPLRDRSPIVSGELLEPIHVDPESASRLVPVAARIAAGFFRPTRRTVIVWVEGDSELAVEIGGVGVQLGSGRVDMTLPVRCDQTGPAEVIVTFAVGEPERPAGIYASTPRRPTGPQLVVDTWGEVLVAFAWKTLLTLVAQLAGAQGKDGRGNVLVPAELSATREGLTILPMGRFRFYGSGRT